MIDVNVWRARIGRFYSVTQKSKHGGTRVKGDEVDMTLWDIIAFCVLLISWAKCVHCASLTMFAVDSLLFVPEMQEHLSWKETMTGEGIVHNEPNIDTLNMSRCVMIVSVTTVGCAFNAVTSLWKILLSNDVERNPGPMGDENRENGDHVRESGASMSTTQVRGDGGSFNADSVSRILAAIQLQTEQMQEQSKQLKDLREEQATQTKVIREELIGIKQDLAKVSQTCQEITQRCSKLESENKKLSARVDSNSACVNDLRLEVREGKEECRSVYARVSEMTEEMRRVSDEIDRLEEFSRRDNLRMHGVIPMTAGVEGYDACARAVCEVLNEVDQEKQWTEEDIARAHRVGQARQGAPKTMIVKFQRWRDKIRLIRDRDLRGRLERIGVRVANDLTRRQADTVTAARREGKAAYFVRGKLTIGPRRPDTFSSNKADTRATHPDPPSRHVPHHYHHPTFPRAFPMPSRDPRGLHTSSSPLGCDVSSSPPGRSDNTGLFAREVAATRTEGDTSHVIAGSPTASDQSTADGSATTASDTDYTNTHTHIHRENTCDETRKDSARDKSEDIGREGVGGRTEVNTNLETETHGIDGPSHTCNVLGDSEGWGQGEGGEGGGGKGNPSSSTDKHTHCDMDSRKGEGNGMEGEEQGTERVGMDEELGSVGRGRGKERVERGKPHSRSYSEPREGTDKSTDGHSVGPKPQRQSYRRIDSYMHPKASEQNETRQSTNRTLRSGRNVTK